MRLDKRCKYSEREQTIEERTWPFVGFGLSVSGCFPFWVCSRGKKLPRPWPPELSCVTMRLGRLVSDQSHFRVDCVHFIQRWLKRLLQMNRRWNSIMLYILLEYICCSIQFSYRTSLEVQWLRLQVSNADSTGSKTGWGARMRMLSDMAKR